MLYLWYISEQLSFLAMHYFVLHIDSHLQAAKFAVPVNSGEDDPVWLQKRLEWFDQQNLKQENIV